MDKLLGFLRGKKTYIVVGLAAVVFVLNQLGYIDSDTTTKLYEALGITGLASLRAAVQ